MDLIVDSINAGFARCESGENKFSDIPLSALPQDVGEGDVITIYINEQKTIERKAITTELMNSLFKD